MIKKNCKLEKTGGVSWPKLLILAPFKSLKIAENRPLKNFSDIWKSQNSVENHVRI